jgi:hypothetical protein
MLFYGNGSERMRLTSAGGLAVGTTTDPGAGNIGLAAGKLLQYSSTAYITPEDNVAGARIVTPGAFNLATGGTAVRMTVDGSGNVGINTTGGVAASSRLTIGSTAATSSDINLRTTQTDFVITPSNSAAGGVTIATSWVSGGQGPLIFTNSAGEIMRFDSSRNVGIGTSAPKTRLQTTASGFLNAPALGSATGAPLYVSNSDPSYGLLAGVNNATGHAWLQAQRTDGSATAYNITLNEAGGNVGVGISTPSTQLHVVGTSRVSQSGATRYRADRYVESGSVYLNGFDDTSGVYIPGSFNFSVYTFNSGGSERMRIGSNGSVAIGGTGTDASLHIQQAYGGYDRLTQMSPNTASKNAFNLMAAKNSSNADLWWSWGVRNDAVWCFEPGVNYSMNGTTGIFFNSVADAFKPGGGTWSATSDARVKTSITPISDAASRIMALKPSAFDYRVPEAHRGRVSDRGFIAQDFEEVYPHSVSESAMVADAEKAFVTGDDKIKAISLNTDFFADLVALVQEQQTKITTLEARLAQLEGN